jgi:hypothetical protein
MHTFVPYSQFFYLLKLIAYVCIPKMVEDKLSAYLSLPIACSEPCNKPPFTAFTRPLFGTEEQVAGPGIRNLRSSGLGPKTLVSQLR